VVCTKNKKKNIAIVLGSIVLFVSALGLVRDQKSTVGDVLWMKAMIERLENEK
jgi:hypothetical protein